MPRRYDIRVDVSSSLPWEAVLAITLVVPDDPPTGRRTVAFGFPGGGYSRGYWDIDWPGAYSQAEHHVARGWIFAAVDHLGVGDSTHPDPESLTLEVLAEANDTGTRAIVEGLRAGTLVADLPAVDVSLVVGMGQSMGGCLSIVAQGRHETFDALAVLGFSAIHTMLPSPDGAIDLPAVERGDNRADAISHTGEVAAAHDVAWAFHFDDVPADLVAADIGEGYPFRSPPVPPWGSSTIPPSAASMLTPGVIAEEAAAIDVPVFIGVGERDVCPDPWVEPSAYGGSSDVSLAVLPSMAHMHNFASTRVDLWDRLHHWVESY